MSIWIIDCDCLNNNDGNIDTDIHPATNTDTASIRPPRQSGRVKHPLLWF